MCSMSTMLLLKCTLSALSPTFRHAFQRWLQHCRFRWNVEISFTPGFMASRRPTTPARLWWLAPFWNSRFSAKNIQPLLHTTRFDHTQPNRFHSPRFTASESVWMLSSLHDNQIVTLHFSWQTKHWLKQNFRISHRVREHNESEGTAPSRMVRVASTLRQLFIQWPRDGLGPVPEWNFEFEMAELNWRFKLRSRSLLLHFGLWIFSKVAWHRSLLVLEALTSWKATWGTSRCLNYGLILTPKRVMP